MWLCIKKSDKNLSKYLLPLHKDELADVLQLTEIVLTKPETILCHKTALETHTHTFKNLRMCFSSVSRGNPNTTGRWKALNLRNGAKVDFWHSEFTLQVPVINHIIYFLLYCSLMLLCTFINNSFISYSSYT